MKEIRFDTVQQFNDYYGFETLHPLVSVARMTEQRVQSEEFTIRNGLYMLYLKETKGCRISYGRTEYDYDEMTVTSFAPGQSIHVQPSDGAAPKWTAVVFHPDFLARTSLGAHMSRYGFFDYTSMEALHLSSQEVVIFRNVVDMIGQELCHAIDKHTKELVVSNIELLLNYCLRFYDRQFITREEINHTVVQKFEKLLREYISGEAGDKGLPSVAYFADKCCLSTGYFGELVKAETGRNARDFIADHILAASKELLNHEDLSVSQVSERLGFDYPQHFLRFFKRHTGLTPGEYRKRPAN
jgi:AraC-like DNA-binding protein